MEILPIDIKKKDFKKSTFGGYSKNDVDEYLSSIADQLIDIKVENKHLKEKLYASILEVEQLKEKAHDLNKTIARQTETARLNDEILEKDKKRMLAEMRLKASKIEEASKLKAKKLMQDTNRMCSKRIMLLQTEMQKMEICYNNLDNHKEFLVNELSHLMSDTMSKIAKISKQKTKFNFQEEIRKANQFLEQNQLSSNYSSVGLPRHEVKNKPEASSKLSFFDEISKG